MKSSICQRCGACCLTVGRTFWKAGNCFADGKPFGNITELNKLAMNGDHEDGELPCEMFEMRGNIGVCLIHEKYGYDAKPQVCKDYPNGELCFREKGLSREKGGTPPWWETEIEMWDSLNFRKDSELWQKHANITM